MDLKDIMTKATTWLKAMFASNSNNNHKILNSIETWLWLSKNSKPSKFI